MKNLMIRFIFINVLFTFGLSGYSQMISLYDLENIQISDLELVKIFLSKKGWKFSSSELDIDLKYNGYNLKYDKISWGYDEYYYGKQYFDLFKKNGFENIIVLHLNDETFKNYELEAKNKLAFVKTFPRADSLITIYKNSRGIEFKFIETGDDGDEYYNDDNDRDKLVIYNPKDLDKRINNIKKKRNELNKKAEKKKQIEEKYRKLLDDAEHLKANHKYQEAKEKYIAALAIKNDRQVLKDSIKRLNSILKVINSRENKVYDYNIYGYKLIRAYKSKLFDKIKNYIDNFDYGSLKLIVNYHFNTKGNIYKKTEIVNSLNPELKNAILNIIERNTPKPLKIYNYYVNSDLKLSFDIEIENNEINLTKKKSGIYVKPEYKRFKHYLIKSFINRPKGKYHIFLIERKINSKRFYEMRILNYKSFGGPEYVILSLLVPGLGKYKLSGGENGLNTTIAVFSLIGLGTGSKLLSNYFDSRYYKSIDQFENNINYKLANDFRKAELGFYALGTILWLNDVHWVIQEGQNNVKNEKKMTSQVNVGIQPHEGYCGLGVRINF